MIYTIMIIITPSNSSSGIESKKQEERGERKKREVFKPGDDCWLSAADVPPGTLRDDRIL